MERNKGYKVRLYPNKYQKNLIDKSIGCYRFLYNQMLKERIEVYDYLKNDKEKLYSYKYKSEKEYKELFPFLKEVPSRALQQTRIDLFNAFRNFYKGLKENKKVGFPKFKSKKKSKWSYRDPQVGNQIRIENNMLIMPKIRKIKFRGLDKNFQGSIKSVTITKTRTNKYYASILVEQRLIKKERLSSDIIGVDLGLKEFVTCSNGETIKGIKKNLYEIENKIKIQQKHLSRKQRGSNRHEKCKLKLNMLYEYKRDFLNHFQWHLVNKLCSENQTISLETLNIAGMLKNRKLSHAISTINWGSFIKKLKDKAKEYDTEVYQINTWFPSSKMCYKCGKLKNDLTLSDRIYTCECGNIVDRDLNASINIKNYYLKKSSVESIDYRHGEMVKPVELIYDLKGSFYEMSKTNLKLRL